ncbi:MAG TPA: sodium:calcium antiporter [Methylomirabilota bacterium]|nr:sodium:calcium antiporter [Methylomirabilota bacterium]
MIIGVALFPLQWLLLHFSGAPLAPQWEALSSGLSIFGAAFLLSWAAELAQLDIPQALALAFLALIAVLPEYAVDIYFAWEAGKNPAYIAYATANMTGANRLLIGVGWATVMVACWLKTGIRSVKLDKSRRLEVISLTCSTIYSFILPLKDTISLFDAVVLVSMFIVYMRAASKAHMVEPELEGPPETIALFQVGVRRVITLLMFAYAGLAIFTAAEPFAEGLIASGKTLGIEEFILVQWLAPLASESPEFIVAILFALRGNPQAGIGTLVSSTVNQWTLLVGMLPIAYCLSGGHFNPMVMDARQQAEVLLTSAHSAFALTVIANFSFSIIEALILLGLFLVQLVFPSPEVRFAYAFVYLALAASLAFSTRATRVSLLAAMPRRVRRSIRTRPARPARRGVQRRATG